MGRKAKCKYCGKSIDTDNAFKVIVGKTNRYYCDENEYNIIHKTQQIKDDTFNLIYDIFGRKVTNTILYALFVSMLLPQYLHFALRPIDISSYKPKWS